MEHGAGIYRSGEPLVLVDNSSVCQYGAIHGDSLHTLLVEILYITSQLLNVLAKQQALLGASLVIELVFSEQSLSFSSSS